MPVKVVDLQDPSFYPHSPKPLGEMPTSGTKLEQNCEGVVCAERLWGYYSLGPHVPCFFDTDAAKVTPPRTCLSVPALPLTDPLPRARGPAPREHRLLDQKSSLGFG